MIAYNDRMECLEISYITFHDRYSMNTNKCSTNSLVLHISENNRGSRNVEQRLADVAHAQ